MESDSRRDFLRGALAGAAALTAGRLDAATQKVDRRKLGRAGVEVPILGLGLGTFFTEAYGRDRNAAYEVLSVGLQLGASYFDTANAYGPSQELIASIVKQYRERIFLVSKSSQRGYQGFKRELQQSLKTLGTDHLDLFHIHSLEPKDDLGAVERGALKAALEARKAGQIRLLGVTGHSGAKVLIDAVKQFNPDVLMTVLSAERRDEGRYEDQLLPLALKQGVGVVAMKAVAFGWRNGLKPPELIRYALSLKGVSSAVVGLQSQTQLLQNAALCRGFQPLTRRQQARYAEQAQALRGDLPAPFERPTYRDGRPEPEHFDPPPEA
ncbi:MAG: aldo/keto reductase [Armatimonadetes bacterium]|nr:aldo/keto reductase [Armatimonadota bacterium]